MNSALPSTEQNDPLAAVRVPEYRRFLTGNFLTMLGMQMQSAAIQWDIYRRTSSPMALGYVGLALVLPVIILGLPAGQLADRLDRRRVMLASLLGMAACSLGLCWLSLSFGSIQNSSGAGVPLSTLPIYVLLTLHGMARALLQPSRASFMPLIVPRERFRNAVTWGSSAMQLAIALGPALGGWLLYLFQETSAPSSAVYLIDAVLTLTFAGLLLTIRTHRAQVSLGGPITWESFLAGLKFVHSRKVILSAMTLDMVAVLLGGATGLIAIYSRDILEVGPVGYGWLKAAPGAGAVAMALWLAFRPTFERAGRTLLLVVASFGAGTVVFGLSRNFTLSLAALFFIGAVDMISVVIRQTLVQLLTPDPMRGRVSAVNGIFIGASNELGVFESGLVARLFDRPGDPSYGATISVVSGGLGTLAVVGGVAWLWPELLRYNRLEGDAEGTAVAQGGKPPSPVVPPTIPDA